MKGEFEKEIRNEAIRNLTLWQMAGNVIREEDAKRKDYVHVETVLKIIDEAQKEFEALLPKKDQYGWDLGDPVVWPTELERLIQKWFGSEGGE